MIHKSQRKRAEYFYNVDQKRKNKGLLFSLISFLVVAVIILMNFGIIPTKSSVEKATKVDTSEVNAGIYEPVAKVIKRRGIGSAFLVGETYLITARHVIDNLSEGEQVQIKFEKAPNGPISTTAEIAWKSNSEYPDELEFMENDFALLRLTQPDDLPDDYPRAKIGNQQDVKLKDKVNAVGYPNNGFSITAGNIMNKEFHNKDLFKHSAGSWAGNSGGPLILDKTGEVIGIVVAEQTGRFKGINMACKIDQAKKKFNNAGINFTN